MGLRIRKSGVSYVALTCGMGSTACTHHNVCVCVVGLREIAGHCRPHDAASVSHRHLQ